MQIKSREYCSIQQGFTLLESIVVLTILISFLSLGSRLYKQSLDRTLQQAVAQQMQQISTAARAFVQDHLSQFNTADPQLITVKQLKAERYLPSHYADNPTNLYQQGYHIQVFPDKEGTLLILTFTTGGDNLSLGTLLSTTQLMGSQGGYVTTLESDPDKVWVLGQYQSWQLNPSDYPLTITPSAGHLAMLHIISPQEILSASNFLWRKQVVDHPEYNQMETDLRMGENLLHFDHPKDPIILGDGSLMIGKDGLILNSSGLSNGAPEITSKLYDFGYGSQLQRNWLKIPYYELKKGDNKEGAIWAFADNLCASEQPLAEGGRLFMLGRANDATQGIFICGKPDAKGFGPSNPGSSGAKSRAYLMSKIGENSDHRADLKITKTETKFHPGFYPYLTPVQQVILFAEIMYYFTGFPNEKEPFGKYTEDLHSILRSGDSSYHEAIYYIDSSYIFFLVFNKKKEKVSMEDLIKQTPKEYINLFLFPNGKYEMQLRRFSAIYAIPDARSVMLTTIASKSFYKEYKERYKQLGFTDQTETYQVVVDNPDAMSPW